MTTAIYGWTKRLLAEYFTVEFIYPCKSRLRGIHVARAPGVGKPNNETPL